MTRYQTPATFGLLGLLCVASPLFLKLPSQFQSFQSTNRMEAAVGLEQAYIQGREELERSRIRQRRQTADTLAQTGMLPNGQKLKLRGYLDNPKHNPNPDTTGWQDDEVVLVFDAAGACVGQIRKRKWLWKHHYQNVCKAIPAD